MYSPQVLGGSEDEALVDYVLDVIPKTVRMFFTTRFADLYLTEDRMKVGMCNCSWSSAAYLSVVNLFWWRNVNIKIHTAITGLELLDQLLGWMGTFCAETPIKTGNYF